MKSFNAVADFFASQFAFDPDSGQTGMLFGSYSLQSVQQSLALGLTSPVSGLSGLYSALSQIGIRLNAEGKLEVDSSVLTEALENHFEDVASLLSAKGTTTSSEVTFVTGAAETKASGAAGWEVEITQAAARARVTSGAEQTGPLAADETLTVNGVEISLSAGMTQSEVVEAINSRQGQTHLIASATGADGTGSGSYLTLRRAAYGSSYHISAVSTVSNLGGGTSSGIGTVAVTEAAPGGESGIGTGAAGLNVAGTIGGEACTGSGQRLTAKEGDPEGVTLLVTATGAGSYGVVRFTVGAAEAAFRACLAATDTVEGTIAREQAYLGDSASDIEAEMTRMQDLIDREQERMQASFVAMERALAQFQSQSQFLASQISQMQANAPKK